MKKSVLIYGPQGSGKTALLERYSNEAISLNKFFTSSHVIDLPSFESVVKHMDIVCIDEVYLKRHLIKLIELSILNKVQFIVAAQNCHFNLNKKIRNFFEVRYMGLPTNKSI
jgi:Holliday junction resolvasome RuvABC ATP-dependent DNA helicase subunit